MNVATQKIHGHAASGHKFVKAARRRHSFINSELGPPDLVEGVHRGTWFYFDIAAAMAFAAHLVFVRFVATAPASNSLRSMWRTPGT
jgi:hypothetical protein